MNGSKTRGDAPVDWSSGPTGLRRRTWWTAVRRLGVALWDDTVTDRAAALTYYSVLSIFPGLIMLTAFVGLLRPSATSPLIGAIRELGPGRGTELLVDVVNELQGTQQLAGPLAFVGLAVAMWIASGYVGAFVRAANGIYEVQEGRPVWKTVPMRLGVTAALVVLIGLCAVVGLATSAVVHRLGGGSFVESAWALAKWPVVALLMGAVVSLLYWVAPNARQPGFRWLTPGSVLAVVVWIVASAGFSVYVAHFGSYNKVYGSLAGAVIFLVWLWILNVAALLGAGLNAELARGRLVEDGAEAEADEPILPPRDTRAMTSPPQYCG
ncbi:YihY/virulence factor BrkB family protein [Nocardia wallacei]|uniref:YihY/virulence factor BrkB family protein n=1 Tax=Nocardia wallacei TaxID=480035 RepID=UPI0024547E2E|nr:YihY/virulence factor BrkB family protein [Nocardia wallacei]